MSETTSSLNLPYIIAAQAQKHVTHNEALRMLDALVQLSVRGSGRDAPPVEPAEGERHIVGPNPTGLFEGRSGQIAAFQDGAWAFYTPQAGWIATDSLTGDVLTYDGTHWAAFSGAVDRTDRLGIATDANDTNRLSLSSPASLFTHAGDDHRLSVNKAGTQDTASLVFQNNYSGRAEMGLTGNDGFAVKVSANGTDWHEAIKVDEATGAVTFPSTVKPLCSMSVPDYTVDYAPGDILQIRSIVDNYAMFDAATRLYTARRTGFYLIAMTVVPRQMSGGRGGVDAMVNNSTRVCRCLFSTFSVTSTYAAMEVRLLEAGDTVSFHAFTGGASDLISYWSGTRFNVVSLS